MLKMLIADDEPVIIRGLQMLIDWAQLGIEICATCENGADALREETRCQAGSWHCWTSRCPARPALKF